MRQTRDTILESKKSTLIISEFPEFVVEKYVELEWNFQNMSNLHIYIMVFANFKILVYIVSKNDSSQWSIKG